MAVARTLLLSLILTVALAGFLVGPAPGSLQVAEAQYSSEQGTAATEYCDWYWGYRFNSAGGWEYWCWEPQRGWWYAESEDGTSKYTRLT